LFQEAEGLFTLGEWAELIAEDQLVSPPTSILPVASRGFTNAFAQQLYDAYTGSNKVKQQVHPLATAGRSNVVERGDSGTPQWMNPAAYAWADGAQNPDVVKMVQNVRCPVFGGGNYDGEKVNLLGAFYGASEWEQSLGRYYPSDCTLEFACDDPVWSVDGNAFDLGSTPAAVEFVADDPSFQIGADQTYSIDEIPTVDLIVPSVRVSLGIVISLVVAPLSLEFVCDDPSYVIDGGGGGGDQEYSVDDCNLNFECDDAHPDISGPLDSADFLFVCDDPEVSGDVGYTLAPSVPVYRGIFDVVHKYRGQWKANAP
jgi:hypothetical protein